MNVLIVRKKTKHVVRDASMVLFGLCLSFSSANSAERTAPPIVEPRRELWADIAMHFRFAAENADISVVFHLNNKFHISGMTISLGEQTYNIDGRELEFAKYTEPGESTVTFAPDNTITIALPYEGDSGDCRKMMFAFITIHDMKTHEIIKPSE